MLPNMDVIHCQDLAVPAIVMRHVVSVESSFNPYAIGVVGGRLARQPATLDEAVATARMLDNRGYDFSLGLAQVNRRNLARYGLASYAQAFDACRNVQAGARILAECHARSGNDWGKALSCYYSGDFITGFRQGYVQKVFASMRAALPLASRRTSGAIYVVDQAPVMLAPSSPSQPRLAGRAGRPSTAADPADPRFAKPSAPAAGQAPKVITLGASPDRLANQLPPATPTAAAGEPVASGDPAFVF